MKLLVIGCGSIGTRHINNLKNVLRQEVIAFDTNKDTLDYAQKIFDIKCFNNFNLSLEENPDAALICTPNNLHITFALKCITKGMHIFIEKPISDNLNGIDELISLSNKKNKVIMVACNMRYHPAIMKIKKMLDKNKIGKILSIRAQYGHYLPNWRPGTDYRQIYSAKKDMGGGIILDAIHEIDYLQWFTNSAKVQEISCYSDKISNLDIDTEDIADLVIRTIDGIIINIHVDYLRQDKHRSCEIIGSKGTINWTCWGKAPEENEVKVYDSEINKWSLLYKETIKDFNDIYVQEMKNFVNAINKGIKPMKDAEDGKKNLILALLAKESSLRKEVVNEQVY